MDIIWTVLFIFQKLNNIIMKQTFVFIAIIFSISISTISAQKKEIKKAIRNGKNQNGYYDINFKKPKELNKIKNWCKKENYVIVDKKYKSYQKFGSIKNGISYVALMTSRDYKQLMELRRQEEARLAKVNRIARSNNNNSSSLTKWIGAAVVVGLAYLGGKYVVKKALSGSSSSSYSGSSYSSSSSNSSSSSHSKKKCYGDSKFVSNETESCSKSKVAVYKIDCKSRSDKNYFFMSNPKENLLCSSSVWSSTPTGYYSFSFSTFGTDSFLSEDYKVAMKKLCECD